MEEDIKILEDFIEAVGEEYEVLKEKQALERIVKGYKELEESKITRERVNDIQEETKRIVDKNYIPKSKVKEKIEELEEEIGKAIDNSKGGLDEDFINKGTELLAKKKVLQELLGDE